MIRQSNSPSCWVLLVASVLLSPLAASQIVVARQSSASSTQPASAPATPHELEGAESLVYRDGSPEPMRLFVAKPKDWKATDKRPAMIYFFGGAFVRGTPEKSISWARLAARWGMVGIAPDYRTRERFGTYAAECIIDGRASLRWVQDHADELGVNPDRIVVGGNSAGGTVALWCGINENPPGANANESPRKQPAALVLMSALTNLTDPKWAKRHNNRDEAAALSPQQHLDAKMPPIIMFHGDADKTVDHKQAEDLNKRLTDSGNSVEFITVPGGSHGFSTDLPEWKDKSRDAIHQFLIKQHILEE